MANLQYAVYGPAEIDARPLSWITYEQSMSDLPHVAWINRAVSRQRRPPGLIVNDSELALNAIKAGIGKSILPCLIADREPGLRRLSGAQPVLSREVWLVATPDYKHVARIKTVAAFLERTLAPRQRASR